jgi:hypothetical protein
MSHEHRQPRCGPHCARRVAPRCRDSKVAGSADWTAFTTSRDVGEAPSAAYFEAQVPKPRAVAEIVAKCSGSGNSRAAAGKDSRGEELAVALPALPLFPQYEGNSFHTQLIAGGAFAMSLCPHDFQGSSHAAQEHQQIPPHVSPQTADERETQARARSRRASGVEP